MANAQKAQLLEVFQGRVGFLFLFLFLFCLFVFFRAAPAAYGSSQARGGVRAKAAGRSHSHSNPDPSRICDLYHTSQQHQIFNTLSEYRDRTCSLMVPGWIVSTVP